MHAFMRTLKYANNNNPNKTCWLFNFTRILEAGIPLPHSILMAYNTLMAGRCVVVKNHPYGYKMDSPMDHVCWNKHSKITCDDCKIHLEQQKTKQQKDMK